MWRDQTRKADPNGAHRPAHAWSRCTPLTIMVSKANPPSPLLFIMRIAIAEDWRPPVPEGFAHLMPGTKVEGLIPDAVVEIVETTPVGSSAFVRYQDEFGLEDSRLFTADSLSTVRPVGSGGLTLDSDADEFRLAVEALRLRHASLLNPLLAVSSSNVEALPH